LICAKPLFTRSRPTTHTVGNPEKGSRQKESPDKPGEFDDYLVFLCERSAANGAESIRIPGGLIIFTAAFAALNLDAPLEFIPFDDPPGFVVTRFSAAERVAAPRAEIIVFVFPFRQGQKAALAESRLVRTHLQIGKHLRSEQEQYAAHLLAGVLHTEGSITECAGRAGGEKILSRGPLKISAVFI